MIQRKNIYTQQRLICSCDSLFSICHWQRLIPTQALCLFMQPILYQNLTSISER